MKRCYQLFLSIFILCQLNYALANTTANQTDALSPVLSGASLPFRVVIEQAGFQLPVGLHSGVAAVYKGLWVLIAGRMNGLHGFGVDPFPPDQQNTNIYVVNPQTGSISSRSLSDPSSGLTQAQIDSLSVTSPQGYQEGYTFYLSGGYGVDTNTGVFGTKPTLTAINLAGLVQWVTDPTNPNNSVAKNISQVSNSLFQLTGGRMLKLGNQTQLVFGQNMIGAYTPSGNGAYSQQVRQFQIKSVGGQLSVDLSQAQSSIPNPNFRRRDLNILPFVQSDSHHVLQYGVVAYAGVFTPDSGVWTVPVVLDHNGNATMADPNATSTFKQAMNHYACASAGLYSMKNGSMYHIFFGGISYGFYSNGVFQTDSEIPFINQVTTIQMDRNYNFTQYLMDAQYPLITSTDVNPGNTLLFGAAAYFIPSNISRYPNAVINLDSIRKPTVIGYIVGGIQSTLANTNVIADSSASSYVFKVTLIPN